MFERGSKYYSMSDGYERYCEDLERWKSHCSQMRTERWIKDHSYPEVHVKQKSSSGINKKHNSKENKVMGNIWEEFDKNIDTEGLAKDVEEAAENGGRRDVPHYTYEVAINKLELTKSKKGDPMVT